MFLVVLIASSFLYLISKQARLNAAVSVFLLYVNWIMVHLCYNKKDQRIESQGSHNIECKIYNIDCCG